MICVHIRSITHTPTHIHTCFGEVLRIGVNELRGARAHAWCRRRLVLCDARVGWILAIAIHLILTCYRGQSKGTLSHFRERSLHFGVLDIFWFAIFLHFRLVGERVEQLLARAEFDANRRQILIC
jgi:hypothetical protein